MNVSVDNFAKTILDELENYKNVTVEKVESAVKKTTKDAVQELKNASPSGAGKYGSWSEYSSGWKSKKLEKKGYHTVIYNSKKPGLTHLLERGHATRNGGRTRAFPHIKPVEENTVRQFEDLIRKAIE